MDTFAQLAGPLKRLALQQMMCYWSRSPASGCGTGILSTAAECLQVRQKHSAYCSNASKGAHSVESSSPGASLCRMAHF